MVDDPDPDRNPLSAMEGGERPGEPHRDGPEDADVLMPAVYDELKRIASRQLRSERSDHTLSPTALVHEAYLRLVSSDQARWKDRDHFFRTAARAMRRILVDHARARATAKRSRQMQVTLEPDVSAAADLPSDEIVAVDEALERLAELDQRQARVVELRYFVGMSIEETASLLGVSPATVKRDWMVARIWLQREIMGAG